MLPMCGDDQLKLGHPTRQGCFFLGAYNLGMIGVSSMKLHRDIGVSQKTAWNMLQRIRKAFNDGDDNGPFGGPFEIDKTYMGGKRARMSNVERRALTDAGAGRGAVGKRWPAAARRTAPPSRCRPRWWRTSTSRRYRASWSLTPLWMCRCTLMRRRPTGGCPGRTSLFANFKTVSEKLSIATLSSRLSGMAASSASETIFLAPESPRCSTIRIAVQMASKRAHDTERVHQ